MSDLIVIKGVRPYDGSYELDLDELTTLEWRWIKKISGYLPANVAEGWEGRDPDLFLAFATIAMVRAGKVEEEHALAVSDVIAHAPRSAVRLELGGEEEPADPPEAAEPPQTENGGGSSSPISGSQGADQSPTGHPGSPRYATSDRLTSVT